MKASRINIKNFASTLICCGLIFLFTNNVLGQTKAKNKAIYIESFGTSFSGFTLNVAYRIPFHNEEDTGVFFSLGAGLNPFNIGYREEKNQYVIPLNVSLFFRKFEIGIGITHTNIFKMEYIPTSSISYSFQMGNIFLKPSINGLYIQTDINSEGCGHRDSCDPKRVLPFPGLSVGYKF
ncbi:MAG: hypothetical protein JXR11_12675 [Balneola sp.]